LRGEGEGGGDLRDFFTPQLKFVPPSPHPHPTPLPSREREANLEIFLGFVIIFVLSKVIFPLPLRERVRVRGEKSISDALQNTLQVVEYLVIPKAQHLIPFSLEPFITYLIAWIEYMLPAVQLYHHLLFEIHKIYNMPANGLLATKLKPFHLSVSEMLP
jgi:hypothetical protein